MILRPAPLIAARPVAPETTLRAAAPALLTACEHVLLHHPELKNSRSWALLTDAIDQARGDEVEAN